MTVHVSVPLDETQKSELERIAQHDNVSLESLIGQLVEQRLAYDKWFRAEVQKGIDDVEAGRTLSNEEVWARMEARMALREAEAK